jgi:hypothetical protein
MDAAEIGQVVVRIQSEFLEHPGLRLTRAEVEGLCPVTSEACEAILALLVEAGVLRRLPDGSLVQIARAVAPAEPAPATYAAVPFARVEFRSFASPAYEGHRAAVRRAQRLSVN